MPQLRNYQERGIEDLRRSYATGHRAPLLQLPTAAGKTVAFAEATRLAVLKGTTTLIAVHRRELVQQASAKLTDAGVEHGIVARGLDRDHDAPVCVCSIQTAIRRELNDNIGLCIIDEAHHAVCDSYRKLAAMLPKARLLGVTATPARLDGKGLGVEAEGLFDDLIIGATVKELTEQGWLAPARVFVAKTKLNLRGVRTVAGDYDKGELADAVIAADLAGDAVAEYRKRAEHQPAVAFAVTVKHGEAIASTFRNAGFRAAHVHGEQPMELRDRLIAGLGTGEIEVLASCEILGEGVDIPTIGAAILMRPTKSLTVHLQQVGRGLRPAPGKTHLTVLDLAGNLLVHGLPDRVHRWTLAGAPKRQTDDEPPGWTCPECGCLNPLSKSYCLACGEPRPTGGRALTVNLHDELVELKHDRIAQLCRLSHRAFLAEPRTDSEIEAYRLAHNYKPGWAWHVRHEQAELWRASR